MLQFPNSFVYLQHTAIASQLFYAEASAARRSCADAFASPASVDLGSCSMWNDRGRLVHGSSVCKVAQQHIVLDTCGAFSAGNKDQASHQSFF